MKKTSIFYGGGIPVGRNTCKESTEAPSQGDPLDDMIAEYRAKAQDMGYSTEEIAARERQHVTPSIVYISNGSITLDGHKLELIPSVKAFYILIANHPEGVFRKDLSKSDYLYEYRDYYISLDRTRALKSQNDTMSFELEKEASKYRTTINKAIERIEAAHGGINLSSCKIYGTKWRITAKVENLMVISLDKDL